MDLEWRIEFGRVVAYEKSSFIMWQSAAKW